MKERDKLIKLYKENTKLLEEIINLKKGLIKKRNAIIAIVKHEEEG